MTDNDKADYMARKVAAIDAEQAANVDSLKLLKSLRRDLVRAAALDNREVAQGLLDRIDDLTGTVVGRLV